MLLWRARGMVLVAALLVVCPGKAALAQTDPTQPPASTVAAPETPAPAPAAATPATPAPAATPAAAKAAEKANPATPATARTAKAKKPGFDLAKATYVGSEACKDCHAKEYDSYSQYSKKAHSSDSIKTMARELTPEEVQGCFACHTTGHGKPGGFVSFDTTPNLANAGCEVCHGPGSLHVDSGGDPAAIKRQMTMKDCEACHNAERVKAFNFKPMQFAGAH